MANGILIVDKPESWTSHDVVGKVRRLFSEKRVGHAGTLDPMATGVLPVFLGRSTRAVEFASESEKEYIAGLRLGITTDTQDTTGTVLSSLPVPEELVLDGIIQDFIGPIEQIPPMYSAIKVQGKKLYELARKGIEVERKPRQITIFEIEILDHPTPTDYLIRVKCSKGTYIRTLCHDIGQAAGCGATMYSLRRTYAAGFSIDCAVPMEQLLESYENGTINDLLLPVDSYFADYPMVTIDGEGLRRCLNGNEFRYIYQDGTYRVYDIDGNFLMLGEVRSNVMYTVKSFFEI